jgi:hypothetical protein
LGENFNFHCSDYLLIFGLGLNVNRILETGWLKRKETRAVTSSIANKGRRGRERFGPRFVIRHRPDNDRTRDPLLAMLLNR